MNSIKKKTNSRVKLAQLWHISNPDTAYVIDRTKGELDELERIVNEILIDDIDINYKVTIDVNDQDYKIHVKECTALHFIYCGSFSIDIFNNVLKRGADVTIKNGNGQTALHLMIANSLEGIKNNNTQYINSVLSAQVKSKNSSNPHDCNGISHLHGACIANHIEAIKFFLENGASANEAVNLDAQIFSGYTPLHFAAHFHSFEAVIILLDYEANVNAKDAQGMTALDLIMEYKLKKVNPMDDLYDDYSVCKYNCSKNVCYNEKIIKILLDKSAISTVGWSRFHIACTLSDLTIVKDILNKIDNINQAFETQASFGSGYTALHFAAINSIEAVKFLIKYGAKFETEDANGLTPLDICIDKYNIKEVYDALACTNSWTKIFLSDGKTKLIDFVKVATDLDELQLFFKNDGKDLIVPVDSPLLPGYTILHLAVIFSTYKSINKNERRKTYDETIVEKCLDYGLDIYAADIRGRTPIHLAFQLNKDNILDLLLRHLNNFDEVMDLLDEDNLSYLHIACTTNNDSVVKKLLKVSEVNLAYKGEKIFKKFIVPGSTPLHVATACGSYTVVELLLNNGANLHAANSNGLTPIHLILGVHLFKDWRIANVLFDKLSKNPKDQIVDGIGLSYLHVACYMGKPEIVEKLLYLGSNVNAVIAGEKLACLPKFVSKHSGYSPIHLAQMNPVEKVIKTLCLYGADAFAKVPRGFFGIQSNITLDCPDIIYGFISMLRYQPELQIDVERRWGLTKLHIACYMKNEEEIKSDLYYGADVNAQINADLVVFSGNTPLHILVTISRTRFHCRGGFDIRNSMKILLDHGANVTITNSEKDTPIHVFNEHHVNFDDHNVCRDLLLYSHQDFGINPVNAKGLSHFHIACLGRNVEIVDKFLQRGSVNVNQPIDCFARINAGCTPLHLSLNNTVELFDGKKLLQIADLLLDHGANVAADNIHGDTPLHQPLILTAKGASTLEKLVRHGADVRSKNIKGRTLFDKWSFDSSIDYASLFIKYGYPFNSWYSRTGEGFISKIFLWNSTDIAKSSGFEKFMQLSDVRVVDEFGCTVIHNSVANLSHLPGPIRNYAYAIEKFIKKGVDIDWQDKSGQTALHYAARMENLPGIITLLNFGADINIIDNNGNSAFSYTMQPQKNELYMTKTSMKTSTAILYLHVKKLQYLKLEVSPINQTLVSILELTENGLARRDIRNLLYLDSEPNRCVTFGIYSKQVLHRFFNQIQMTKTVNVEVNFLTIFDFLNDTGIVSLYPYLSISERSAIADFLNSNTYKEFDELSGILKLQFRKMIIKLTLIDAAIISLRALLGFSVPGLCEEITRFLTNMDLKNLIASAMYNH